MKQITINKHGQKTPSVKAGLRNQYPWFGFRRANAHRAPYIFAHGSQSERAAMLANATRIVGKPIVKEQSEALAAWEDEGGKAAVVQPINRGLR